MSRSSVFRILDNEPLAEGQVHIRRDIGHIFLIGTEDFLGLPVHGVVLLDIDDVQFVVHPLSETEPFYHSIFIDAANGHTVVVWVTL